MINLHVPWPFLGVRQPLTKAKPHDAAVKTELRREFRPPVVHDITYIIAMVDERTAELVAHSSKVILANHIEPADDITQERKKATIDVQSLSNYLYGGQTVLDRQ